MDLSNVLELQGLELSPLTVGPRGRESKTTVTITVTVTTTCIWASCQSHTC